VPAQGENQLGGGTSIGTTIGGKLDVVAVGPGGVLFIDELQADPDE
jgi:hypothetical protein